MMALGRVVRVGALGRALGRRRVASGAPAAASGEKARERAAQRRVVVSLMGRDRVGIVNDFAALVRQYGGSVEGSRMVKLGGEFAMIVCVRAAPAAGQGLAAALRDGFEGFTVGLRQIDEDAVAGEAAPAPGLWYLELEGPDSEGIVAAVSEALVVHGGSVRDMKTETVTAPFAGFPLFKLEGNVALHDGNYESISRSLKNVEERFGCTVIFKQAES